MADKEILTDDEKEALMQGVDSGDVQTGSDDTESHKTISSYDFSSQETFFYRRLPKFDEINKLFLETFEADISEFIGKPTQSRLSHIEVVRHDKYLSTLDQPANVHLIGLANLKGSGIVHVERRLGMILIDLLFGGVGSFDEMAEPHEFTNMENRVLTKLVHHFLTLMQSAWSSLMDLGFQYQQPVDDFDNFSIGCGEEMLAITRYELSIDENPIGTIELVIPFSIIESIQEELDKQLETESLNNPLGIRDELTRGLMPVPVSISSTVIKAKINLRELRDLKAGDVIAIDEPNQVSLDVESIPVYYAKFGTANEHCALKIISKIPR